MQQHKELHLATNLEALHQIAININRKTESIKKPKTLMTVARKLYNESQNNPLDEEMTYILLCRFIQVYERLMVIQSDTAFINLIFGKDFANAKVQISDIKNNLINRYEQAELKKLVTNKRISVPTTPVEEHTTIFKGLFITCLELYCAFFHNGVNLLVIDARDEADFTESRLKDITCINIPDSCIQSGLSAHILGQSLPAASKENWMKRASFVVIVLMDWNTTNANYSASKLDKLRNILVEWDIEVTYKEGPVILNGGYKEWLDIYPMFCTNPDACYAKANTELDDLLNLDNIEYPVDSQSHTHGALPKALTTNVVPKVVQCPSRTEILTQEREMLKQSTKIIKEIISYEKYCRDRAVELVSKENDESSVEDAKQGVKEAEESMIKLTEKQKLILERKSQLANMYNLAISFNPGEQDSEEDAILLNDIGILQKEFSHLTKARELVAQDYQDILEKARRSKKPAYKKIPTVDRATKPKFDLPKLVRHIEGNISPVKYGLTGLVNVRNTCYMNAVIQCLRHIPDIMNFFCGGVYCDVVRKKPPKITAEMAHLIRSLWSNLYSYIKPIEFYNKFVSIAPSYKKGFHEDCMEFFLALFNFLNEDSALDISAGSCWTERERAWYKQHSGKTSFYIETFYYQLKIQYNCETCHVDGLKFEIDTVFYLPIPNRSFSLEECLESYIKSPETMSCRSCKASKMADKIFVYYPPILIINLKRYIPELNGTYRKNDNPCTFPIKDLQVGTMTYSLNAIALHKGDMQVGHYTAVCRNIYSKQWFLFNDERVESVNITDYEFKTQAYVFFYTLNKGS